MLMAGALLCLNLSIYSQSISLKMSNVSVKKAMTELQSKSGYSFVYIAGDVDTDRRRVEPCQARLPVYVRQRGLFRYPVLGYCNCDYRC